MECCGLLICVLTNIECACVYFLFFIFCIYVRNRHNAPQLLIQVLSLIGSWLYSDNFDISAELVTIFSLTFTLVSIGISMAEYMLNKQLIASQYFIFVSFDVLAGDLSVMKATQFKSNIIYRRHDFLHELATRWRLQSSSIDRLKPLQTKNGAVFCIVIDAQGEDVDNLKERITEDVLAEVYIHIVCL